MSEDEDRAVLGAVALGAGPPIGDDDAREESDAG